MSARAERSICSSTSRGMTSGTLSAAPMKTGAVSSTSPALKSL
jgi:hypothetical protein